MRKVFSLILLMSCFHTYGQHLGKNIDFIIVIDENIFLGSITQLRIVILSDGKAEILSASYYPGNLSLSESDFEKMISDNTERIFMKFTYTKYTANTQNSYSYEIELKKHWFDDYFNILRIYNLDNKRYQKLFYAAKKEKAYVYELDSPSNTFHLIRNK